MHREFIQKLTELVEANLANEHFGPEELAKTAGMSHSNLNRKLKTLLNQSASQFIRGIRLKKARDFLLGSDITIAEVAFRVGFGSPTYFSKCFHEYFGYAPGELKNNKKEDEPIVQHTEIIAKKHNRIKSFMGIAVIIAILVPMAYFLVKRITKEKIKDKSIAVLPFKYLGDDAENQYRADGMMSVILKNLSKIYDLRVVSETSVEQYRHTLKTSMTIGKELQTAYLLEGRLIKMTNGFKLVLQLIRTRDDRHIWANEFQGDRESIYNSLTYASEEIARFLTAKLTNEELQQIRKKPALNATAYDFYQKGIEYEKRGDSASLENAVKLYRKALECDSTFAKAYVGMGRVYAVQSDRKKMYKEKNVEYHDSVLTLVNTALSYDDKCVDALILKASIYENSSKKELALREYKKAQKYDPNNIHAYSGVVRNSSPDDVVGTMSSLTEIVNRFPGEIWFLYVLGTHYCGLGFPEIGQKYINRILELEPDSGFYFYNMAKCEQAQANHLAAYYYSKKVNEYDLKRYGRPNDEFYYYCMLAGKYDDAKKVAKQFEEIALKTSPLYIYAAYLPEVAFWYLQEGDTAKSNYYFNYSIKYWNEMIQLGKRGERGDELYILLAKCYLMLGDKAKAYSCLDEYHVTKEEAAKYNIKKVYNFLDVEDFKTNPFFDSIRHEPRFQAIITDVEKQFWEKQREEHEQVRKWLVSQGMISPNVK